MLLEYKENKEIDEASIIIEPTKRSPKKIFLIVVLTLILLGVSIFTYFYSVSNKSPFTNYENTVGFQLYYPSPVPSEYFLDKETITNDEGVLFYTLRKSDNTVVISQQKSPDVAPDFNILKDSLSFKEIETENGSAVNGLNNGLPSAILLTNTTLITVNGSKEVPSGVVIELIKNMRSL